MYNCGLCRKTSEPNRPVIRWPVYKAGTRNIAVELLICGSCHAALRDGMTVAELKAGRQTAAPQTPTVVKK